MAMTSVEKLVAAIEQTLASYDDDRTWSGGVLAVVTERGAFMGDESVSVEDIDVKEFAGRLLVNLGLDKP